MKEQDPNPRLLEQAPRTSFARRTQTPPRFPFARRKTRKSPEPPTMPPTPTIDWTTDQDLTKKEEDLLIEETDSPGTNHKHADVIQLPTRVTTTTTTDTDPTQEDDCPLNDTGMITTTGETMTTTPGEATTTTTPTGVDPNLDTATPTSTTADPHLTTMDPINQDLDQETFDPKPSIEGMTKTLTLRNSPSPTRPKQLSSQWLKSRI